MKLNSVEARLRRAIATTYNLFMATALVVLHWSARAVLKVLDSVWRIRRNLSAAIAAHNEDSSKDITPDKTPTQSHSVVSFTSDLPTKKETITGGNQTPDEPGDKHSAKPKTLESNEEEKIP